MLADPMEASAAAAAHLGFTTRSKRIKMEASNNSTTGGGNTNTPSQQNPRHYDATGSGRKTLELQGVIDVLKEYDDYEGGINCSICGKLYKSKVCFVKHIWEHSIYWDLFDGEKNHDRVLSIQAALILYSKYHAHPTENKLLSHLLVTAPNSHDKKREKDTLTCELKPKTKSEKKSLSPLKRKKSFEEI